MKVENGVRVIVGIMILISALLAATISMWWLLFTAFIGMNLIQSAFTDFCLHLIYPSTTDFIIFSN